MVNSKPVKTIEELQAALDALEPGAKVTLTVKSKGKDIVLQGSGASQ